MEPGVAAVIVTVTELKNLPPLGLIIGAFTVNRPLALTGIAGTVLLVPSPNSPSEFKPQPQTEPSFFSATLW